MLREISGGISSQARDRLRDLREALQARRRESEGRQTRHGLLPPEIEHIIDHAAGAIDDTMTAARSLSLAVFPELTDARLALLPLERYFAAEDGGRLFRHHIYRAARIAGARSGPAAAGLVRETVLHDAFIAARRQCGRALAALRMPGPAEARATSAAEICAVLMHEIVAPATAAAPGMRVGCYAPGLLASAWASVDGRPYVPQTLELAMLAVGARQERLAAAAAADDPVEALSALFESMLLHLA